MGQVSFKPPQTRAVSTTPTAVASWPITETSGTTITDAVGGVVLTLQGDAALTAARVHGYSSLSGSTTTTTGALDLTGGLTAPEPSSAITVMCWVKTTTTVPDSFANAISKATGTYDTYGLFVHYGGQNTPACQFKTTNNASGEIIASSALLADHAWHHLAMTYDGATVKLYCDGTQVGSASATGTLVYSSDRLSLMGSDHWGNKFIGEGAEFRIYNVALTQAQIATAMGAITITGLTISADHSYAATPAASAQDDNPATYWSSDAGFPRLVKLVAASAVSVSAYRLQGAPNGSGPSAWTFQGSNDGTAWTTLDTVTGNQVGATEQRFVLASTATYSQFRVNMTAGNFPALAEFHIEG